MKRLLPLMLIGVFGAVQHIAAQGMGGGAPAYSQTGHPVTTSHNPTQELETTKDKAGAPPHVSVTVAAEQNGSPATSFPTKTPHLYGSFTTTNTNKGEKVYAVWVNSATKKPIYKTDMISTGPNFPGTVSINAPPTGWPAGKYELDIYLGNKRAARAPFTMKGN